MEDTNLVKNVHVGKAPKQPFVAQILNAGQVNRLQILVYSRRAATRGTTVGYSISIHDVGGK